MEKTIRFVVVSDNHRLEEPLDFIRNKYRDFDYFVHCGDSELPSYQMKDFAIVCGNNDYFSEYPQSMILPIGSHRIYLTHGHRDFIFGKYEMLAARAKELDCDMVCFGHTHVPYDATVHGIRLLNPGSIWHNRDGSQASYMLVTLQGDDVHVELKRYELGMK